MTVYDAASRPIAWAGRVSDLAKALTTGPAALVAVPGALGPRLVRVEPVSFSPRSSPTVTRDATIVVEQSLADPQQTPGPADSAIVPTSIVPVTVRTPFSARAVEGTLPSGTYGFTVAAPSGGVLVDAEVARADLDAARAALRNRVWAISLTVFTLTLLMAIGPLIDRRRRSRTSREYLALTAGVAVALLAARGLALAAISVVFDLQPLDSPLNVLMTGLTATGLVALAISTIERRRIASPRPAYQPADESRTGGRMRAVALYFAAGALGAALVGVYEQFLQRVVTRTHLDVLHFSLHPIDFPRFAVGFGLILLHAAIIWGVALLVHTVRVLWRTPFASRRFPRSGGAPARRSSQPRSR